MRLIQIRYPDLLAHLVPIETPRELAAKLLRRRLAAERARPGGDRHLLHHAVHRDHELDRGTGRARRSRYLDGAFAITELYGPLLKAIKEDPRQRLRRSSVSPRGLLWAMAGGEISGMRNANTMTVRGLRDVIVRLRPDRVGEVPERRLHRGVHLPRRLRQRAA